MNSRLNAAVCTLLVIVLFSCSSKREVSSGKSTNILASTNRVYFLTGTTFARLDVVNGTAQPSVTIDTGVTTILGIADRWLDDQQGIRKVIQQARWILYTKADPNDRIFLYDTLSSESATNPRRVTTEANMAGYTGVGLIVDTNAGFNETDTTGDNIFFAYVLAGADGNSVLKLVRLSQSQNDTSFQYAIQVPSNAALGNPNHVVTAVNSLTWNPAFGNTFYAQFTSTGHDAAHAVTAVRTHAGKYSFFDALTMTNLTGDDNVTSFAADGTGGFAYVTSNVLKTASAVTLDAIANPGEALTLFGTVSGTALYELTELNGAAQLDKVKVKRASVGGGAATLLTLDVKNGTAFNSSSYPCGTAVFYRAKFTPEGTGAAQREDIYGVTTAGSSGLFSNPDTSTGLQPVEPFDVFFASGSVLLAQFTDQLSGNIFIRSYSSGGLIAERGFMSNTAFPFLGTRRFSFVSSGIKIAESGQTLAVNNPRLAVRNTSTGALSTINALDLTEDISVSQSSAALIALTSSSRITHSLQAFSDATGAISIFYFDNFGAVAVLQAPAQILAVNKL